LNVTGRLARSAEAFSRFVFVDRHGGIRYVASPFDEVRLS